MGFLGASLVIGYAVAGRLSSSTLSLYLSGGLPFPKEEASLYSIFSFKKNANKKSNIYIYVEKSKYIR